LAVLLLLAGAPAFSAPATKARPSLPPNVLRVAPSGEPGARLTLSGTLVDSAGQPVAGAELHVYQTDASGRYTFAKPMDEPHARLAGTLRTGPGGRFEISSIRPGGYPKPILLGGSERKIPAHIHIDVKAAGHPERRFQAVFADDPLLADPYWKDWVKSPGQPVLELRKKGGGLLGTLLLRIE
jgi:protocatechuate 3,4-dioxygenase beta subunit